MNREISASESGAVSLGIPSAAPVERSGRTSTKLLLRVERAIATYETRPPWSPFDKLEGRKSPHDDFMTYDLTSVTRAFIAENLRRMKDMASDGSSISEARHKVLGELKRRREDPNRVLEPLECRDGTKIDIELMKLNLAITSLTVIGMPEFVGYD